MSVYLPQNVLGVPPTGNFSINPWGTTLTAVSPPGLNLGVDPYLSIDRSPAPNFDTFEEYEVAVAGSSATVLLPLKLTNFAVKAGKEAIDLRWNTENEENMRGFNVERSIDGKKFKSIGSVDAKNVGKADYTYTDKDVTTNQVYYYRLRMIDKDGKSRNSEVQSAKIEAAVVVASTGVNIYPNPTNGNVSLDFTLDQDTHTEVDVFDITGKLSLHKEVEAKKDRNLINLEMLDMPSGVYTVRINMGGKVTNKLVKVSKN
jgi:Secretion system C-terminal sorting domain